MSAECCLDVLVSSLLSGRQSLCWEPAYLGLTFSCQRPGKRTGQIQRKVYKYCQWWFIRGNVHLHNFLSDKKKCFSFIIDSFWSVLDKWNPEKTVRLLPLLFGFSNQNIKYFKTFTTFLWLIALQFCIFRDREWNK